MTKRKYPRFNTKSSPAKFRMATKLPKKPKSYTGLLILILLIMIGVGLYFSGINNGPRGKLNCTDAEIAANVACR